VNVNISRHRELCMTDLTYNAPHQRPSAARGAQLSIGSDPFDSLIPNVAIL